MSTLKSEGPLGNGEYPDEILPAQESKFKSKHLRYALYGLSVLFSILFIVFWLNAVRAFRSAWFALFSGIICFVTARNIALYNVGVYKIREPTLCLKILTILSFAITSLALLLVFIDPPTNVPDKGLQPTFMFILLITLLGFAFVMLRAPTNEKEYDDYFTSFLESDTFQRISQTNLFDKKEVPDKEPVDQKEKVLKCRDCCRDCGSICSLILIFLASLGVIVSFAQDQFYVNDSDALFVSAGNGQDMNFRCEGEGEPLVLLFHGYTGQAIDLEHILLALSQETTTCSFSRLGYGLSREFGERKRTSENFAIELNEALQNLDIPVDKFNNTILVGHSMAGFNMRAYDELFKDRVSGMVMIDPVHPDLTDDCFEGGISLNNFFNEALARITDLGTGAIFQPLNFHQVIAPIDELPNNVQGEYTANIYRSDYFLTSRDEADNWGETCEFVKDHTADYPVTVVIAEKGIYDEDDDVGLIQLFSSNENSTTVFLPDCDHTEAVFNADCAQVSIDAARGYIAAVQNNPLD